VPPFSVSAYTPFSGYEAAPHLSLLTGYAEDPYTPASYTAEPFASRALAQVPAGDLGGDTPGDAAWRLDALCAETDPEAFFPEKGGSTREAKRVCHGCAVRSECLEYALANDERFGIWGGLSERERRRVRLARRMPLSA
jgi:WhiB family redox-sensing transcriptional regulator